MNGSQELVTDGKLRLEELLGDKDFRTLYANMSGRFGPAAIYARAVELFREHQVSAMNSGYQNLADMYGRAIRTAHSLLDEELNRKQLVSPTDADSRVICDAETGVSSIVFGGGPQEGGYSVVVFPEGANKVVLK